MPPAARPDHDTDVLIVGAGPTGLLLALDLARRGVDFRIVDKGDGPSAHSKALAVQARSLEIYERLGIHDQALRRGFPVEGFTLHVDNGRTIDIDLSGIPSAFPYVLMLPQDRNEAILREALARHDRPIDWDTALTTFDIDPDGVTATLEHGTTIETLRARYLVGCDGAHSTVRHTLDLPFDGHGYGETFCVADLHADIGQEALIPGDRLNAYVRGRSLLILFPLGSGQHRAITIDPERTDTDTAPDLATVQALVDRVEPDHVKVRDVAWSSWFRVHCRTVPRFRQGPVFLAGDAAHIHSPAGGQGLNTGLQDAYNLGWKLAQVLRGHAHESLLDTYHRERHPVAERVLSSTDRMFTLGIARNPVTRFARNQVVARLLRVDKLRRTLARFIGQTQIRYRQNPAVERRVDRQVAQARWERGVRAGVRAPDAALVDNSGDPIALRHLLTDDRYTLLLWHGTSHHSRADHALVDGARLVADTVADQVRVVAIQPGHRETTKVDPWYHHDAIAGTFLDPDGAAHRAYGAHLARYTLVRPDGHVGFANMPADVFALQAHLARNLTVFAQPRGEPAPRPEPLAANG